jgi:hypothetical protein
VFDEDVALVLVGVAVTTVPFLMRTLMAAPIGVK